MTADRKFKNNKSKEFELPEKPYPLLELEVKVFNINEGRNAKIAARCKKLAEYSAFIAKIHEFWKELSILKEGIKGAIKYCSKHDIPSVLSYSNDNI